MSAQPEGPIVLTLEEYLKFEHLSEVRHELIGGQVVAMAGGTERHDLLTQLINVTLVNAFRGTPCRVFTHDRKVLDWVSGDVRYPDVMVCCGPARHPQ